MLLRRATPAGVILLAIALQITATLRVGTTPLRASAADPLLPLALTAIASHLLLTAPPGERVSSALARLTGWRLPWPALATLAIATTLVLCIAVFVGKSTTGVFSQWALINKLGGWGALLGFALLGYFIAGGRQSRLFLRTFVSFAIVVAVMTYLAYILQTIGFSTRPLLISNDTRVGGLMTNPSAFGFLAAVVVIMQLADMRAQLLLPYRWHMVGVTIGIVLILLTGSRSAWIGLAFGVTTLVLLRHLDWRRTLTCALAAIPLIVFAFTSRDVANAVAPDPNRRAMVYVLDNELLSSRQVGIEGRLDQLKHSLELWLDSPWLGIGLGSYILDDAARGRSPPQNLHNSALWLLTETGILGAIVFGALFVALAVGLWPGVGAPSTAVGAFAMLMVFAGVSIGTEALYQRHVWVIFGIALATSGIAAPRSARKNNADTPAMGRSPAITIM